MSYFDDNEDRIVYGGHGPRRHNVACRVCGEEGLKWRLNDAGDWRLYSEERSEHNQKLQHNCRATEPSADDFDAVD